MTTEQLQQRIQMHKSELAILQASHEKMVADFQAQVGKNQSRFAQLNGAIAELEQLVQNIQQEKENQNDNIPASTSIGNRIAHVCPGIESQDS
jgi:predicted  nucleic acid-binding Zn-ribbon protein